MSTDLLIILSSDWVGSTATRTRIGEEPADALQEVHDSLLRKAINAEGGNVAQFPMPVFAPQGKGGPTER